MIEDGMAAMAFRKADKVVRVAGVDDSIGTVFAIHEQRGIEGRFAASAKENLTGANTTARTFAVAPVSAHGCVLQNGAEATACQTF